MNNLLACFSRIGRILSTKVFVHIYIDNVPFIAMLRSKNNEAVARDGKDGHCNKPGRTWPISGFN